MSCGDKAATRTQRRLFHQPASVSSSHSDWLKKDEMLKAPISETSTHSGPIMLSATMRRLSGDSWRTCTALLHKASVRALVD